MMSIMLSLFSFHALEKTDLGVFDFWLFIEWSILEWFLTWFSMVQEFQYVRIFKVQSLSDWVHGCFRQNAIFKL